MSTTSRRPSAAMIVAVIALVAALTGGAYAATKIGTSQIQRGAVTKKKLHAQSVTTPKLVPSERSQGFVFNDPSAVPLTANASTTVATLNLPQGANFVVTAAASLGNNTNNLSLASCELRDDGVKVTAGNGTLPAQAVFGETITLTGTSNGGVVSLACQLDHNGQARDRVITAVRVASLGPAPPAP